MDKNGETDISSSLNDVIKASKAAKTVNTKKISDVHHTFGDLYNRERILFRLITFALPKLSFKSLYHYDEENDPMFNGDFMVGLYTPRGPISYHFKLKYLDDFAHLDFSPRGPRYDNYSEDEKNERINCITQMIEANKTEDEILAEILGNPDLDESLKPPRSIIY